MTFAPPVEIDLDHVARGTPCLTAAVCANLVEAAVVCLEHVGHASGVGLRVGASSVALRWDPPDPRARASHRDLHEATEEGAMAIAVGLLRASTHLEVVERSWKGTGFDYFLGPSDTTGVFERTACLEVSGVLDGDADKMAQRLRQKLAQIQKGGADLPGYAVVVGFGVPSAAVRSAP